MALLFKSEIDRADWWAAELAKLEPELEVRVWPDVGDPADIEFALVWMHEPGSLKAFPNLKGIFSLGAGVDHIFRDPDLPPGVPITRVVDPDLTDRMTEYVLLHVLRYHRQQPAYDAQQARGEWRELHQPAAHDRRVGVMGLGVLGRDAAGRLADLGFRVAGWSRSAKEIEGVETFHGRDGLDAFLARTDILVCLLPLTPATEDILDARLFARLPEGAYLINAARGRHLVEEDLLAALDSGRIAGATLDVFRREPLPPEHPFWRHPKVTVTPHIASITDPRSVARQVVENIHRLRAGRPPLHRVDPAAGY